MIRLRAFTLLFVLASIQLGCPSTSTTEPDGPGTNPPGKLVYPSLGTSNYKVFELDFASGNVTTLWVGGNEPFRTSTGTTLYVSTHLMERSANTTQATTILTTGSEAHRIKFKNPQQSRDGQYIAYQGFGYDVFVIRKSDGSLVASFRGTGSSGYTRPTWTTDGNVIMTGASGSPGIFVGNITTQTATRLDANLADPTNASVSPDGSTIAFVLSSRIYTMPIAGGTATPVLTSNTAQDYPTWSPDGKWIAFHGYAGTINALRLSDNKLVDVWEDYAQVAPGTTSVGSDQFSWGN
jgi:dipeptidyl aminopeptidase/acylaminoacyl peptidase